MPSPSLPIEQWLQVMKKRPSQLFSFLLVAFLTPTPASAGEPDDFAGRADREAPIANEAINTVLNVLLEEALSDANSSKSICSKDVLKRRMFYAFDRNFPEFLGALRHTAHKYIAGPREPEASALKPFVSKHRVMWIETFKVKTKSGEHMIGLDKIDHFFGHGYLNWVAGEGGTSTTQREILRLNHDQESGPWGLKTTNVKSYADLSANHLGVSFWKNLVDGPNPHVICKDGKFTLSRKFDLFTYLDASVDETINCSSFATAESVTGFLEHAKKMNSTCPVSKKTCQALTKSRPGNLGELTLHPLCRGLQHDQLEVPTPHTVEDILSKASGLLSGGENLIPFWFNRNNGGELRTKSGAVHRVPDPPPRQISSGPLQQATVEVEPSGWRIDLEAKNTPVNKANEKSRTAK